MRIFARLLILLPLLWVEGVWAFECARAYYEMRVQDDVDELGFTGCTRVSGDLVLRDSYDIRNLNGLANLTSVGGSLKIYDTSELPNLDGLANLTSVGSNFFISDNAALTNLDGLARLTSVGGHLEIRDNPALANLNGLVKLRYVGGLRIGGNALTNLDALASLKSVGGYLSLSRAGITNLYGLRNLRTVGGQLSIDNAGALTNLDGLKRLYRVGDSLFIRFNSALTDCRGIEILIGAPEGPPYDGVGGPIRVDGNGVGCNSLPEILASFPPEVEATTSEIQVTEAYIGMLGRAPDPAGLAYWVSQLNRAVAAGQNATLAMKKLTNDITLSDEWQYPGLGSKDVTTQAGADYVVQRMYEYLFERAATQADLDWWTPLLTGGSTSASEMAVNLITAAKSNVQKPTDGRILHYKRLAATYFAQNLPQSSYERPFARWAVEDVSDGPSLAASKAATQDLVEDPP